jgi:hypothetical protein
VLRDPRIAEPRDVICEGVPQVVGRHVLRDAGPLCDPYHELAQCLA